MGVRPVTPRISEEVARKLAELTVIERIFDTIDLQSRSGDTVCQSFSEKG